jgi:ATP-dependent DNA helicase HFM1/MER3
MYLCAGIGIAYHHGGLRFEDRRIVETLFAQGDILFASATSTLSQGVNLPAHLVIIKGTSMYVNGSYENMNLHTVQQMCGRAGRPGFDSFGIAVIMTHDHVRGKNNRLYIAHFLMNRL